MSQRFTVDLEWTPTYRMSVSVEADDLKDANEKALAHASRNKEAWSVDGARPHFVKIVGHAPIDWTQHDASQETVMEWMKANAKSYTFETLAHAAHSHFARPFHIDVMRQLAQRALSAGPG